MTDPAIINEDNTEARLFETAKKIPIPSINSHITG
jgi:hypothetical protein